MTFRILSLDGGGIRGVISAKILEEVERQIGELTHSQSLHQYFDMVAGTSTGSILTAGIATKNNSESLTKLYEQHGQAIFPYQAPTWPSFLQPVVNFIAPAKYSHDGLENALRSTLKDEKIKDIEKPLVLILAYDMRYRNTTFFTNCHPDLGDRWYDDLPLWKLSVSSSSAPTFFRPYELKPENTEKYGNWSFPHIDGGVSANNPALAAVSHVIKLSRLAKKNERICEEVKKFNIYPDMKIEDISVLSIGTGQTGEPFEYKSIKEWRGLDWISHLVDVFMEPTSEIESTICQNLMGGSESERYLRLQFNLNERYEAIQNETYKDTRTIVAANQRINRFTKTKVTEDIDDARSEIVKQLQNAAKAFIEDGCTYYTRNDQGPRVTQAIASFIENNTDEKDKKPKKQEIVFV